MMTIAVPNPDNTVISLPNNRIDVQMRAARLPVHYELLMEASRTFDIFSLFLNLCASQTTIGYQY